jgi:hypothetical protein
MSWWRKLPDNRLSDDESWFIGRYPLHVAQAFIAVSYDDSDPQSEGWQWRPFQELVEEAIISFKKRLGGLDDATFEKVLHEATDRDRLTAIFALGHNHQLPQAADLLAPFLASPKQLERCAAACCLSLRQDERALPILEEYFLCEPPIDQQGQEVPEASIWYNGYRSDVARLLATWGPSSITPLLRKAFLHLWEKEQAQGSYQVEYDTQDALMYALGRRGALGALHGIALPPQRLRLSMLYLALGYLRADERFNDLYHSLVSNEAFKQEVKLVLAEHFALSEEECQDYVESYGDDYFARMDHMGTSEDQMEKPEDQMEKPEREQYRGFE